MCGSVIYQLMIYSITLFMVHNEALGCSPPEHHAPRTFRARARAAEVVVFATVLESPAEGNNRIKHYYSAKLVVHCILKGSQLPKYLIVSGFGNDGGGCTTTDAVRHKSYIFLLRKSHGRYVLHKVDIAVAAKPAKEKLLLKMLPDFWLKAHKPYTSISNSDKLNHCPSFKRMKRILRKSMRKFIRSKPKLSHKIQQLKEWLKNQRKLRKAVKRALKSKEMHTEHTPHTTMSNNVESRKSKAYKNLNSRDSLQVMTERSDLLKRSNMKTNTGKANYRKALSPATALSSSLKLVFFAWLLSLVIFG